MKGSRPLTPDEIKAVAATFGGRFEHRERGEAIEPEFIEHCRLLEERYSKKFAPICKAINELWAEIGSKVEQ